MQKIQSCHDATFAERDTNRQPSIWAKGKGTAMTLNVVQTFVYCRSSLVKKVSDECTALYFTV